MRQETGLVSSYVVPNGKNSNTSGYGSMASGSSVSAVLNGAAIATLIIYTVQVQRLLSAQVIKNCELVMKAQLNTPAMNFNHCKRQDLNKAVVL